MPRSNVQHIKDRSVSGSSPSAQNRPAKKVDLNLRSTLNDDKYTKSEQFSPKSVMIGALEDKKDHIFGLHASLSCSIRIVGDKIGILR